MGIIIYSARNDSDEERLLRCMDHIPADVCRSIQQLRYSLNVPSWTRKILILIINDQDEMRKVSKLVETYNDLLLIIVLDPDYFETAADIHKFRPRYITYKDSDFQDVEAVVCRMMRQSS